jgi:hypothetical protein
MSRQILIGFADSLAAIESAWSLADDGFEVHAFARAGQRPALARSRGVTVSTVTPPEQDAERCAADIGALARDLGVAAVLPLDDFAVWLTDHEFGSSRLGAAGNPVVAGPTGKLATLALDKREQLRLAESVGMALPPSGGPEVRPGPGPWFVKPALAVELKEGRLRRPSGRVADSAADIDRAAAAIGGPVLVQQRLRGTGEGIFGIAARGEAMALSAHRRIRMMNPAGSGSSACGSVPVAPDVVGPVRDLIRQAGWNGLFMIELLRDTGGQPWFMELNGRAWGSMALARRCGYQYPSWAVQLALDPSWSPAEPAWITGVVARHLGREIVHLGIVLARGTGSRQEALRGVLTVRSGDRWYNYRRGSADVFLADTWATLRHQLAPRAPRWRRPR